MKKLFEKLTETQREKVLNNLREINDIFTESENGFDNENIDEYYKSKLYKAIEAVMSELDEW